MLRGILEIQGEPDHVSQRESDEDAHRLPVYVQSPPEPLQPRERKGEDNHHRVDKHHPIPEPLHEQIREQKRHPQHRCGHTPAEQHVLLRGRFRANVTAIQIVEQKRTAPVDHRIHRRHIPRDRAHEQQPEHPHRCVLLRHQRPQLRGGLEILRVHHDRHHPQGNKRDHTDH